MLNRVFDVVRLGDPRLIARIIRAVAKLAVHGHVIECDIIASLT